MLWGTVFADEVTMAYSGSTTANMTGENDAALLGLDATAWSVIGEKGGNSNFPGLNKAGDFRLYYDSKGGNTITVESLTGATINNIAITFTGADYSNVSVTVDGNAVNGTDGTYAIGASKFVLGNANTSNVQVRIKSVVINYGAGGQVDTRVATTLTLGDHATTGEVGGTLDLPTATVTANGSAVANAQVTWTSSNEAVATISGSTINLLTAGTTTIKAEYAGDATNYKGSSANYTLTVTNGAYTSIAAMLQDVTATKVTATYKFDNLLVTYVNGSNTYVSDGTNGFLFYGSNLGMTAGDKVSGTVTGQLYTYNGLPEMSLKAEDVNIQTVSTGNDVAWPTITPADLKDYINKPAVIKNAVFVSASKKNLTFKVDDTEFVVYNNWSLDIEALTADKAYDLTGVGCVYVKGDATTYQLYLVSFEEAGSAEPAEFQNFSAIFNNQDGTLLTAEEQVQGTAVEFGVAVDAEGKTYRVAADDAKAIATISGKYHSEHGMTNLKVVAAVPGAVKILVGQCTYSGKTITVTNAAGEVVATATPAQACWKNDRSNVTEVIYNGEATTLTITGPDHYWS